MPCFFHPLKFVFVVHFVFILVCYCSSFFLFFILFFGLALLLVLKKASCMWLFAGFTTDNVLLVCVLTQLVHPLLLLYHSKHYQYVITNHTTPSTVVLESCPKSQRSSKRQRKVTVLLAPRHGLTSLEKWKYNRSLPPSSPTA